MPIYEYQCQACGYMLEKLQKINEVPLVDCPQCNQPKLSKQVSLSSFKLKGGGWYETDFKNKPTGQPKSEVKDPVTTDTSTGTSTGAGE